MTKTRRNFNMTDEGHRLLKELAHNLGISMSAVLELLIREEAERRGIKRQDKQPQEQ